jgi:hypothetical protein
MPPFLPCLFAPRDPSSGGRAAGFGPADRASDQADEGALGVSGGLTLLAHALVDVGGQLGARLEPFALGPVSAQLGEAPQSGGAGEGRLEGGREARDWCGLAGAAAAAPHRPGMALHSCLLTVHPPPPPSLPPLCSQGDCHAAAARRRAPRPRRTLSRPRARRLAAPRARRRAAVRAGRPRRRRRRRRRRAAGGAGADRPEPGPRDALRPPGPRARWRRGAAAPAAGRAAAPPRGARAVVAVQVGRWRTRRAQTLAWLRQRSLAACRGPRSLTPSPPAPPAPLRLPILQTPSP